MIIQTSVASLQPHHPLKITVRHTNTSRASSEKMNKYELNEERLNKIIIHKTIIQTTSASPPLQPHTQTQTQTNVMTYINVWVYNVCSADWAAHLEDTDQG